MKPLALAAALTLVATNAHAGCGTWETVSSRLAAMHKEVPVSQGLTKKGQILHIWASIDGETWSITITSPDGMTCIMQTGHLFERSDIPVEESGA